MKHERGEIVIPELAGTPPGLGLGDLIRWAPVIEQVVTVVEAAIAGGATEIPVIKVRVGWKRVTIGPTPLVVE